jgi:predicted transposase YbfD/YdcC
LTLWRHDDSPSIGGSGARPPPAGPRDNVNPDTTALIRLRLGEAVPSNSRNRQEYRHVQVFHADRALDLPDWDEYALKAICVYRRTWIKDTKTGGWDRREDIAWYITNQTDRTAEFYAAAIRGHWGIENRDHRVRDGAFAEDASRIRVNPGICARVRSIALNIFRFNEVENVANEQWRNAMSIDRALAYNGL